MLFRVLLTLLIPFASCFISEFPCKWNVTHRWDSSSCGKKLKAGQITFFNNEIDSLKIVNFTHIIQLNGTKAYEEVYYAISLRRRDFVDSPVYYQNECEGVEDLWTAVVNYKNIMYTLARPLLCNFPPNEKEIIFVSFKPFIRSMKLRAGSSTEISATLIIA